MKIAISGSSGFIGHHLTDFFTELGEEVVPLPHTLFREKSDEKLKGALAGCDVVINLAGSPINTRWTDAAKRRIRESRVQVTRSLVKIINEMPVKPGIFISASAVGIYPDKGTFTESTVAEGKGFLADVCRAWEDEAQKLSPDVRLVIMRLGVVLSSDGGALSRMLLPFRLFMGGKIASGRQGFSWIHIEDLVNGIWFVIQHPEIGGIVNLVSPQPLTNAQFAKTAGEVLHRPVWFTMPAFVFRLLYGEGEVQVTKGQQAYPGRLLSTGYIYRYGDLTSALRSFTY